MNIENSANISSFYFGIEIPQNIWKKISKQS